MIIDIYKLNFALQVFNSAFKEYKIRLFLIVFLGFLAGLFGGLGVGTVVPLFSILVGEGVAEMDRIGLLIQSIFKILHLPFNLPFLVLFVAVLFVLKAIVQFCARYVNYSISSEYERSLRSKIFAATMNAGWTYLLNQKTGYAERIIMNDIYRSSDVIFRMSQLILLGTSLSMYTAVALGISAPITILTLGFGALLFLVFKPFFYKTRKIVEKMAAVEKVVTHQISESIIGAKTMKVMSVENSLIKRSDRHFEQLKNSRTRTGLYQAAVGNAYEPFGFVFIALLFIFYHNLSGFNVISFAAVIYLVQKMFGYAQSFQGNAYQIGEAIPYLQAIASFHDLASKSRESNPGTTEFDFKEKLDFKGIRFSYNPDTEILSDLTFSVKKGQMVGLIGPSGVGKTTVADLVLRLFEPSAGKIMIDNRDISEIDLKSWRNSVGYVSQDMFLLNDTIENNIKFFDERIGEQDIIRAAKMANIYDFVEELPNKFSTIVGERGMKISAGQRQRVVLARVLARNPEILILDEATSSLDVQSESLIQQAIENLKGKITVIAIAHRLSTIMNADKLFILENGIILEEGSPEELLQNKDSHFYKIYEITTSQQ